MPLASFSRSPKRCRQPCAERPLRRMSRFLCGVRLVGTGKRTAWSGKGGPRRFLSCTVPPRAPPPNGEAPHRGSSKARSSRAAFREGTAGRARGSACGIQPADAGGNALEHERQATSEVLGETARRLGTIIGGELPSEETQTFPPPQPLLLDFQGTTFRSTTNRPGRPTLSR